MLRLQAMISNNTVPALSVTVVAIEVDGLDVLAVAVPSSVLPVATSSGKYVRRALDGQARPMCVPFFVGQSIGAGMAMDPSAVVVAAATWDDIDPLEIERLRRLVRENPARADRGLAELSDLDIAKALGVVEANG